MRVFQLSLRLLLLTTVFVSGCAVTPHSSVRGHFQSGQSDAAIVTLEESGSKDSRNVLLYHMEKGLILHHQGKYKESSKEFIQANRLLAEFDYLSVSEQTSTLLTNDWVAKYKGEYSEKLWIHSYQMMNFLLLGDYEGAAVEARQSLNVLEQYPESLEDDWFTRALIGLSFESVGKVNDAYIVYKNLAEKIPSTAPISKALYQSAKTLGFSQKAQEHYNNIPPGLRRKTSNTHGELILFVSEGAIPEKVSTSFPVDVDLRVSFPAYRGAYSQTPVYEVRDRNASIPYSRVTTELLDIAQQSLDARGKKVLTKQVARASLKHNVAKNVKDQNEAAGALLSAVFFLLEEADTRGWSTLPAHLSLLRIPLKPGTHNVVVNSLTGQHGEIGRFDGLSISTGQRVYGVIRH